MAGTTDIINKLDILRDMRSPAVSRQEFDGFYNEIYNGIVALDDESESYRKEANKLAERVMRLERMIEDTIEQLEGEGEHQIAMDLNLALKHHKGVFKVAK